ncbi:MAG: hypothetical protein KC731_37635, partial [Myxococcales bacterium]|nr:hypothetical protein [Myxococcales bacterium]
RASEDARTTLVPGVVVTRGLEDALDLVLGSFGLTLGAGRGGWMTAVYLQEPDGERRYTVGDADLRHASCAASDEDYERARDHADRLRRSLPTFEQVLVAELFPDEPWADELLAELLDTEDGEDTRITALASAARDPVLLTRLCRAFPSAIPQYALDMACVTEGDTLLSLFAEALPPLLEKPRYGPLLKTPPRLVATAIGLMNTRAAAEALAPYLGDRVLAPVVTDFFREHPEHAAVLATHATGRGKATAERLAEQRRGPETEGRVADPKEVPAVLRDRPWRPGTMKGPAPRVAKATLPEGYEERVELPEQLPEGHVEQYRAMTKEELAKWRASVETGDAVDFSYSHTPRAEIRYLQVPPEEGLAAWSTGRCWTAEPVLLWVAAHGLAALDGFIQPSRLGWLDYELADQHFAALCCFVSPRMAPMMARIAVARKKWRAKALRWLERHVETVALGLVVAAAGAEREPRSDAEQALLHLAGRGHAEVLRAAAKRCGDEVMAILDELLARDPLAIDAKPPKRPAFLHLDGLPAVTLTNGARLDDDARDALTEMLAVAPRGYPGLARVAEACDAESLAGFAGGLLEQWLLGDAPGRHDWMLHAVVHVPSEANERRVAELARDWARNKKAKAFRACEALGMLGTDRALMHLGHIAATSRFA